MIGKAGKIIKVTHNLTALFLFCFLFCPAFSAFADEEQALPTENSATARAANNVSNILDAQNERRASDVAQRALQPASDMLVLDAESITYDEEQEMAVAEGEAILRYGGISLKADRITMGTTDGVVRAWGSEENKLVIEQGDSNVLYGEYLEYNIYELFGKLQEPRGITEAPRGSIYIQASELHSATPESAHQQKWVHGKYLKNSAPDAPVLRGDSASYTTCFQESPHYRLRSKKAVMLPEGKIILYRPRVYAGSAYLFALPFNVITNQKKKKNVVVRVMPDYDDDKRYGIKATVEASWKKTKIGLGASYWSEDITEYEVRVDQMITPWMSVYIGDSRLYDDDLEETKSRPYWGSIFSYNGWNMEVGWAQREKRSFVQRPGQKAYETTLWRMPEAEITSPWISLHTGSISQYARLKGNWGSFQETGSNSLARTGFIERYGWGFDYYTQCPFMIGSWEFTPFIRGGYWNYGYKNAAHNRQIVAELTYGIRVATGFAEFGSAFSQKRVTGRTAFQTGWDSNSDNDTFYQRVGLKIGKDLRFSVQGIWDIEDSKYDITSVAYILTYDNNCCTSWELTLNDDKTTRNNNNWITFSFAINAFPDTNFKAGNHTVTNPFGIPSRLKLKRPSRYQTQMERDGTAQELLNETAMPVFDI